MKNYTSNKKDKKRLFKYWEVFPGNEGLNLLLMSKITLIFLDVGPELSENSF